MNKKDRYHFVIGPRTGRQQQVIEYIKRKHPNAIIIDRKYLEEHKNDK